MALFVPLDVDYASDDKLIEAGPMAELLYVRALAFSKRTMSDGTLRRSQLAVVGLGIPSARKHADRLVEVGAWTETDDGWQITAWFKHNHSAKAIKGKREERTAASLRANHQRWHIEAGKPNPSCALCIAEASDVGSESDPDRIPPRIQESESESEGESEGESESQEEGESSSSSTRANTPDPTTDDDERITRIVELIADLKITRLAKPPDNPTAYRRKVIPSVFLEHGADIRQRLTERPAAPDDVHAAAALGDTHSLAYYPTEATA